MKWEDERRGRLVPPEREVPRHRARKDRRRWCGGHVGRKHEPTITLSHGGQRRVAEGRPACGRLSWRPTTWACAHEERCTRCGKILRRLWGRECPAYVELEVTP